MASKAHKWTYEEAKEERDYIQSIDPAKPGFTFNHNPSTFAQYCDMQANQATHSGYPTFALHILDARNAAKNSVK